MAYDERGAGRDNQAGSGGIEAARDPGGWQGGWPAGRDQPLAEKGAGAGVAGAAPAAGRVAAVRS